MIKSMLINLKNSIWLGSFLLLFSICCSTENSSVRKETKHAAILTEEFIYEIDNAPTPECHASTIAESNGQLVTAWFGGTKEKNKDVGIWVSRQNKNTWSKPVEVVNGVQKNGVRYPCWNPVLFQPQEGPLMLFYKVGPNPEEWWGMLTTSEDGGKTWSTAKRLPDGILGPIKNKPIQLTNGDVLCPTSTEHDGWKAYLERTSDLGVTWTRTNDLNDGKKIGAIQPTILTFKDGNIQLLCRTQNGFISECWSGDNGLTWSQMIATSLPNPNSGIDAVTLKDGRQLLVYNPTSENWGPRVPLSIAVSTDGKNWNNIFDLEPLTNPDTVDDEEYSYPGVIQTADNLVHVIYTWNRKTLKHVVIDPAKINAELK